MGIVAHCPNGHRIKVKDELAGRKGICPTCNARFRIPLAVAPATSSPRPGDATVLPAARVVSLDPLFAASLPEAHAVDEAAAVAAAPVQEPAEDQLDFVLVTDEQADAPAAADASEASSPSPRHAALDERPDLAWCIAIRGGTPSAPLAASAMRAWLDSGAATADHVVWRADWPEWRPLGEVFPDAMPPAPQAWP